MADLIDATDEHIHRFYGNPLEANGKKFVKAYVRNGAVLGIAGIVEDEKGEWYGFIDNPTGFRKSYFYRTALKMAEIAKNNGAKKLKTICQHDIPRSEEFLTRLGFVETSEEFQGKAIWEWHF